MNELFLYVLLSSILLIYVNNNYLKGVFGDIPFSFNNAQLHIYSIERMDLFIYENIFSIIFLTFREEIFTLLLILGLLFFIHSKVFIIIVVSYIIFNIIKILITVIMKYWVILDLVYEYNLSIKEAYCLHLKKFSYEYIEEKIEGLKEISNKDFIAVEDLKQAYKYNDEIYVKVSSNNKLYKINEEYSMEESLATKWITYEAFIAESVLGPVLFTIVGVIL